MPDADDCRHRTRDDLTTVENAGHREGRRVACRARRRRPTPTRRARRCVEVRGRRAVALAAVVAVCVVSAPSAAVAGEEPGGDTLPTPFTAEEIRGGFVEGLEVDLRMWSPDGEVRQRWRVIGHTPEACTMESVRLDADGHPVGEPETATTPWTELRDHARFPAERARRERAERETALGRFEGWLYTVAGPEGSTTELFFADAAPGAPVWMQTSRDGEPVFVMEQLRRKVPGES